MGSPGAIVGKQTRRYLFWSELLLPEHLLFQRPRLMPKLTHGAFMVDMVDTMVDIEDMDTLDTIDHMVDVDSMDMEREMLSLLLNQLPNPLLMLKPMLMLGTEDTDMVDTHTTVDTDMEDMPTDHTDTTDTEVTGVKHLLKISFQMLI